MELRERFDSPHLAAPGTTSGPVILAEVDPEEIPRLRTDVRGLDQVLGGGIVRGTVVLIGGEPGIGKSTLLLQACLGLARRGSSVLYVTAEETLEHIRLRAGRLGEIPRTLLVFCEADLASVRSSVESLVPKVLVLDSVQTVYTDDVDGVPGGILQTQEVARALVDLSRVRKLPMLLVSHVTKEGDLAGPRGLEHLVDTVLHFDGDREQSIRALVAVKNRFGPTGEKALFVMTSAGLLPYVEESQTSGDDAALQATA